MSNVYSRLVILLGGLIIVFTITNGITPSFAAPAGQFVDRKNAQLSNLHHQDPLPVVAKPNNFHSASHQNVKYTYNGGEKEISHHLSAQSPEENLHTKNVLNVLKSFQHQGNKVVKRSQNGNKDNSEQDDDDDNWNQRGVQNDGINTGDSSEASKDSIKNGLAPVKGPYMKLAADGTPDDDEVNKEVDAKGHRAKSGSTWYRNWDEYVQHQKASIKETVAKSKNLVKEGAVLRSVPNFDDHFRFMDKLFREKNDRVKTFHALVLFMKEQGKDFKIPQNPIMNKQT